MTAPVVLGDGQVRLDEVYLAGSTGQGPAVVGGLGLLADMNGLTVLGPQPSSVRTMPWGRASTIACHRLTQLPDGTPAVMLEVDIDGSALRFFVPQRGLGSEGAVGLERRLTALSRVPVAPSPPVGIARDGSTVNAPSRPAQPQTVSVSGAGAQAQAQAQAQVQVPAEAHAAYPGKLPPGLLPPGALPPATGGTLSVSQGPTAGQYVQAASRRRLSRKSRIAAALVVILVAGGAAAYVVRSHTGTSSPSGATSADALGGRSGESRAGRCPWLERGPGNDRRADRCIRVQTADPRGSSGSSKHRRRARRGRLRVLHQATRVTRRRSPCCARIRARDRGGPGGDGALVLSAVRRPFGPGDLHCVFGHRVGIDERAGGRRVGVRRRKLRRLLLVLPDSRSALSRRWREHLRFLWQMCRFERSVFDRALRASRSRDSQRPSTARAGPPVVPCSAPSTWWPVVG